MTLLLARSSGALIVAPLYYKIFVGDLMCPADFGKKHPNSDKVTCKILGKQPKFGYFVVRCNKKFPW